MPNYVKNVIQFSKNVPQDRIAALYNTVVNTHPVTGEGDWFDFNTLIPMPEALNIESGSNNDIGMLLYRLMHVETDNSGSTIQRILRAQGCWDVFSKDDLLTVTREYKAYSKEIHPDVCKDDNATEAMAKLNSLYNSAKEIAAGRGWTPQIGDFQERYHLLGVADYVTNHLIACMKRNGISPGAPDALSSFLKTEEGKSLYDLGQRSIDNLHRYKAMTWYEWCNQNWGTKWNSCDNDIDIAGRTIIFSTAWSCPMPIVAALADKFPDVDFIWKYADEDTGSNTGRIAYEGGNLDITVFEDGSADAYAMYVECWGDSDCLYQDESGAWQHYDCDTCPHKC